MIKKRINTRHTYLLTFYNAVLANSMSNTELFREAPRKRDIIFVEKIGNDAIKFPTLYNILWNVLLFLWTPLFVVYNLFILFKAMFCNWMTEKKKVEGDVLLLSNKYILKRPDVAKALNIYKYILLPFDKAPKALCKTQIYTVFSLTTIKDIFTSFINTLSCFIPVIKQFGYDNSIYMLDAFRWFLCFEALKKLPEATKIYTCNQRDRWAILVDNLPLAQINLIQHGTNFRLDEPPADLISHYRYDPQYDYWYGEAPQKLSNFHTLYAYTEKDANAIIKGEHTSTPRVKIIGHGLTLENTNDTRFSVLIIGCSSIYLKNEEKIIENLQNTDINIIIKPHPTLGSRDYKHLKNKYTFTIAHDYQYPKVDVVISYESTLAYQYENLGVKVLLCSRIDIDNIRKIILQHKYEQSKT